MSTIFIMGTYPRKGYQVLVVHLVGKFGSMIIAQEMYYIEMFSLPTVSPGIIPINSSCHLYENTSVQVLTHTVEEE